MNYQKKYETIISRIENLLDAWKIFEPSMKQSREAFMNVLTTKNDKQFFQQILKGEQDLIKFLNELLEDDCSEEMPSGAEIVKREAFIYSNKEELTEGKMLVMAKNNLKQLQKKGII